MSTLEKQIEEKTYKPSDFKSDQEPRWCPGCEDYAIIKAFQTALAELGIPKEKHAVISGIGCAARLPYYMSTYGFHTIHGRPIPIATGVKIANPELSVWVITGDGDGISIGGNHLIHVMRRNVDINILLFDNKVYGLTKGQYSPTSNKGTVNKSAPFGTIEEPAEPVALALASGATFVARTSAAYVKHLTELIKEAHKHKGTSFIHIYQNCYIYNDGVFDDFTRKEVREERNLILEHGKPLIFGKNRDKGLRFKNGRFEIVEFDPKNPPEDLTVHDETNLSLAFALSKLYWPEYPVPMGIFRRVSQPSFEEMLYTQIEKAKERFQTDIAKLLYSGDIWEVR
ncbi:2-oxoglutarate oxidoreductase subunit KorB [bacterium HR37]|jgi:2-oxoglutarate ferredoxin oxidoreductase subunit beta|nr:2-oxoglutarate oxidoreductase subunit KorB [bacterium HR37]